MINKSRQHFYESQKQQMVLAAQSYVQDNRNILPRNVGGMQKIKLSVLREKNYLKEDIIDQDKNVCDQDAADNPGQVKWEGGSCWGWSSCATTAPTYPCNCSTCYK